MVGSVNVSNDEHEIDIDNIDTYKEGNDGCIGITHADLTRRVEVIGIVENDAAECLNVGVEKMNIDGDNMNEGGVDIYGEDIDEGNTYIEGDDRDAYDMYIKGGNMDEGGVGDEGCVDIDRDDRDEGCVDIDVAGDPNVGVDERGIDEDDKDEGILDIYGDNRDGGGVDIYGDDRDTFS